MYNLFTTLITDNIMFVCRDFNIDILKLTCPKVSHFTYFTRHTPNINQTVTHD